MKLDIIGDIHGCYDELVELTTKLGYSWTSSYPTHPEKRHLAFVGDLMDRGPHSLKVIELVWNLVVKQKKRITVLETTAISFIDFSKEIRSKLSMG